MLAEFLAEKLTFKQGIVYLLVEGFQFRLKEVGELLNITETAVKSVLFRARNQVKKKR
ncbi:sigma factor-like helix-turn-helix DNA-binding protein [Niallia circulans]